MKFLKPAVLFTFIAILVNVSCKTKKENLIAVDASACDTKVTYETLQPLLTKSCNTSGCHDESKRRMNFKIYANLKSFGDMGEIKEHVLIEKNMPPSEKLSSNELKMIRCWLEGGMLEK